MGSQLVVSLKKQRSLYDSNIRILSPAKLNLYLNIIGRYPDGFHKIESIIERISLCDVVSIRLRRVPDMDIVSNEKSLVKEDNLCLRAARLMCKRYKIPFGFSFHLKKNIPVGAGLGGGSSNAASTLLGINRLLGLKLGLNELYDLGRQLGSDVNFFLSQSSLAFVQQRGEAITPLVLNKPLRHYIIWPRIPLSTKQVYAATSLKLTKFFNNVNIMRYALAYGDIFLLKKGIFNALEQSAFSVCWRLQAVKRRLNESGIFFAMTGSGSAFFSIDRIRKAQERQTFRFVRNLVPKEWSIFCAQTF